MGRTNNKGQGRKNMKLLRILFVLSTLMISTLGITLMYFEANMNMNNTYEEMNENQEILLNMERRFAKERISNDLLDLSIYLSMVINSTDIDMIIENNTENCAEYLKIQSLFQSVMEVNDFIDDIYVMVKTDNKDIHRFSPAF